MVWEMHRPPEQTGDVNIVDGEVRDRIKELRTQGLNYKEIARVMHLNKFSVYDILEGLV
jgi:DNA invertase Pin-like site-specific DNA recombinase